MNKYLIMIFFVIMYSSQILCQKNNDFSVENPTISELENQLLMIGYEVGSDFILSYMGSIVIADISNEKDVNLTSLGLCAAKIGDRIEKDSSLIVSVGFSLKDIDNVSVQSKDNSSIYLVMQFKEKHLSKISISTLNLTFGNALLSRMPESKDIGTNLFKSMITRINPIYKKHLNDFKSFEFECSGIYFIMSSVVDANNIKNKLIERIKKLR